MRIEEIRGALTDRLRVRRGEIEQAALTRIHSFSEPEESSDPEYMDGLRMAVRSALDYGIDSLERSEDRAGPIPTALLSQARLAARNRVGLDTVLRRYFAGYTLLGDFVIEEAERAGPLRGPALKRLLRAQAILLDRILAAVSEEYAREREGQPSSAERRRAERVQRLLDGELLDTADLAYRFEGNHLGIAATGPGADSVLEALAKSLDRQLLLVRREESMVWAWLGGQRAIDPKQLTAVLSSSRMPHLSVAIGEPAQGLPGWRLTHRQAAAALPIALRDPNRLVRYVDIALLASMLQDDLLVSSLRQLYLAPLERERDGGTGLRETLGAYFTAQRNVTSTAAALGVNRNTIAKRLRTVEDLLDRPLGLCAVELELALRLDELGERSAPPTPLAPR